jgi:glycogen debranching enzyme
MRNSKAAYIFVIIIWIIGCKSNLYETLPVIKLTENDNKQFTYTNKKSGFYTSNSQLENTSNGSGWIVNNISYLIDYRIYNDSREISRDSLIQFDFNPVYFKRHYKQPLTETFTFLDTINAIIWEFESDLAINRFSFQPRFDPDTLFNNYILSSNSLELIISPEDQHSATSNIMRKWIGFKYVPVDAKNVVIIAALESSNDRLSYLLNDLSENYKKKKKERIERNKSILELNNTYTNIPEISEALAWSQLSLDALLTGEIGRGIWAGIPGLSEYLGRESFMSFSGALLVNGRFNEAKDVFNYFGQYQLQNEGDTWDGRIPNQVTSDTIYYNTSDVTWLFIRDVYEYLLYTGDETIIEQVFPIIKRAINGAIRYRIDENFFLLHMDAETWMNITGPEGAISPRGNRAIEIQALWYTSLQIGAILAQMNGEDQLADHWLAISQSLKKNFVKKYWSSVKKYAYDHLDRDGFPDRSIRPNQIFTVYLPQLHGIASLFTPDQNAMITSQVLNKLTYRYGVASLWQEDKNFHPWFTAALHKTGIEALHNGAVWTWLSGPLISSTMLFNRSELAFNLFYENAMQILIDNAIGSLGQLRDALPRRGHGEPLVTGALSYAMSLAEFNRNFYQDFIGYQPDAMHNRIVLSPKIPVDMWYISTRLPFRNTWIIFTYTIEEKTVLLELQLEDVEMTVDVSLHYPGFDPTEFRLDKDHPSMELSLNTENQRSYHQYQDLDWHFAQPIYKEKVTSGQE